MHLYIYIYTHNRCLYFKNVSRNKKLMKIITYRVEEERHKEEEIECILL